MENWVLNMIWYYGVTVVVIVQGVENEMKK